MGADKEEHQSPARKREREEGEEPVAADEKRPRTADKSGGVYQERPPRSLSPPETLAAHLHRSTGEKPSSSQEVIHLSCHGSIV
ncbi:uncharacterized protein [Triticum aestivum]|uniref:uncharacterized protein isoform X2 n=1 Tax=Triticum aestivum TaxID=4565 RepID=UPI001D023469|nr:uncharacterized protein LOC123062566 isoform X2 [Triticum aestivum]